MPARDPSRPFVIPEIDELLWELALRYRCEVLRAYERHDLSGTDVLLVEALAKNINTPTTLSHTLGWAAPHVTHGLHRLEARKLAARRQNPRDARSVHVTLTPEGRMLVDAVREIRRVRLEAILTDFPSRERERLQRYLFRLTAAIAAHGGTTKEY